MKNLFAIASIIFVFTSCDKLYDSPSADYVQYTILKGQQSCTSNPLKVVETSEMNFLVKFDSSAIYTTQLPVNQYDINKLYGFSDNNADHQQFSARFGWRWSDGALRLFAYTYNNGVRDSKEIGTVAIGSEVNCDIKVVDTLYIFTMNDKTITMSRKSTTSLAKGYKLYPYFGGDEIAPHDINIWIRQLN